MPCVVDSLEHGKCDGKSADGNNNDRTTRSKKNSKSNLLPSRNLQRLNDAEGNNHEKGINHNTACDEVYNVDSEGKAFVLLQRIPSCGYGPAAEDDDHNVGEAVGADESHGAVDGSTDKFVGRDSQVEGEDGEFRHGDGGAVNEVCCCACLPELGDVFDYRDIPHVVSNTEGED